MINTLTWQAALKSIQQISLIYLFIPLLLLVLSTQCTANYRVRFVNTTAYGKRDGSSWANASNDLHRMINQSHHGDQILIAGNLNKPNNLSNLTSRDRKSGVKGYIMSMCSYRTTKSASYVLMDPNNPLHLPKYSINWQHSIAKNRPSMYLILQII